MQWGDACRDIHSVHYTWIVKTTFLEQDTLFLLREGQEELVHPVLALLILRDELQLLTKVEHDVRKLGNLDVTMLENGRCEVLRSSNARGDNLHTLRVYNIFVVYTCLL